MKTKITFIALLAVMIIPVCLSAVSNAAPIFLTIEPGSRSGAMGHAYVAQVDDAFAGWWNPGAMAFNRKTQIAGIHSNWFGDVFDDMYYEYIGWNQYIQDVGNVGINLTYMTYGEQQYTTEGNVDGGSFTSFDVAVGATYATQIAEDKGVGVTFKFIYSSLGPGQGHTDTSKGRGMSYAFDVGYEGKDVDFGQALVSPYNGVIALYNSVSGLMGGNSFKRSEFSAPINRLDFGANLQNVGPNIVYMDEDQSDPLPITMRMGYSYRVFDSQYSTLTINADMSKILANDDPILKRLFTAWYDDFNDQIDEDGDEIDDFSSLHKFINSIEVKEAIFGIGAEYIYLDLLSIRAGYVADRAGEITGVSVGAGIHKTFSDEYKLGIDFAMQPAGGLTDFNQTYSLKLEF